MKKYALLSLLSCSLCASAWNVGTEPTKQNALIEEFTGIHCPNCPDGLRVATELTSLHPENVFTVAIHAGSFANPYNGQPNFITETGTAIHDYFGANSYPSATINRTDFGNGTITGRNNWGSACREATSLTSPVNLWTTSSYNPETRLLTVEVEGYLTADMQDPRLSVWLLQSEVIGPQSGGGLGEDFPHRHMLRGKLTDDHFGDPIEEKTTGQYFKRTFEYTLPEKLDEIPTDPANTQVLCFVSEGKGGSILQVSESRPDTSSLDQTFAVNFAAAPLAIDKNYAFDYIEVFLQNFGGTELTSADFNVTLNGTTESRRWTGLIPAHTNMLVRIPLEGSWADAADKEANKYSIRLMKANDLEVETKSLSGSFNELFEYPADLTVKIKTDLNASDNTWRILDTDGNVVKEFGPYEDGKAEEYTETASLEPGKVYALEIFDRWGDGVRHPVGSCKLYDANGKSVAQLKEINGYGVRQFFRTVNTSAIENVAAEAAPAKVEYFDLSGRRIAEPEAGIYVEVSTYPDGSMSVAKKNK